MEASFSFERTDTIARALTPTRPSLTYWQDAWRRFKANPRSLISLYIVVNRPFHAGRAVGMDDQSHASGS